MIIGICGKKGSGKDTVADFLVHEYGFHKTSFAEPLKQICQCLFELTAEQLHDPIKKEEVIPEWNLSPRQMFQKIGTDLFRKHFDQDIWLKLFRSRLKKSKCPNIVVADVRFQNEADLVKENGGLLIEIRRQSRQSQKQDFHESENVEINNIDKVFLNDGSLEELFQNIQEYYLVHKEKVK